jgi:hypothetical protein
MERFINECVLISEGKNTIDNISILNESFADKFKEAIKKIITAIGKMWAKFIEAMNTLVLRDKAYLEKYKDIILKKKPKEADYDMYDYPKGVKLITSSPVPVFNYDQMKGILESDDKFIEGTVLKNYIVVGSKESYIDQFKTHFRGSSNTITIKSTQFNMTDAYNYCYNYKSIEASLKKDRDQIEKAALAAIDLIDTMVKNGEIKNEATIFDSKMYYSHVYEGFNHEEDQPAKPGTVNISGKAGVSSSAPSSTDNGNNNPAKAMQNTNGETDANDDAIKAKAASGEGKENTGNENVTRVKRYINLCGGVLGAKQTVSEEIYKAYMSIIRAHVRDFVGTKDKNDDKPKDTPTNYGGDNNSNNNANNNNNSSSDQTKKGIIGTVKDWISGGKDTQQEPTKK